MVGLRESLGTVCLTGFRTVQLFAPPERGACAGRFSAFFWVELGYILITAGSFLHSIGKADQDNNVYLGSVGCMAAVTLSFLITLYAMHEHMCG